MLPLNPEQTLAQNFAARVNDVPSLVALNLDQSTLKHALRTRLYQGQPFAC